MEAPFGRRLRPPRLLDGLYGGGGVRKFLADRGITYPVAIVGQQVEAFGGVRGIPTSFLLDQTGRIRHRVVGPLAPATLELAVRRLLADQ